MTGVKRASIPMKSLLLRPTQLVALVFALALMLALAGLASFTWLDYKRIDAIRARVNRTVLLQESEMVLMEAQLQVISGSAPLDRPGFVALRAKLAQIPLQGTPVGPVTVERLSQLDRLLTSAENDPQHAIALARALVNQMLDRESHMQTELLDATARNINLERRLAIAAVFGFPIVLLLTIWALRERIFRPIRDLRRFLSRLSHGNFTPVSLSGIDPLLLPVYQNYNQMVLRLEQLEQDSRNRTSSLEQEVYAATQALLKQQQSLARAERLAAAGEVSATLAHELRNPIAGIHVTLANLGRELTNTDFGERIDLVIAELLRITRLLNGLLHQSSHVPEPPRMVDVDRVIAELATLIRYQLPQHIKLCTEVSGGMRCRLPEDGVRQALLNLVLNSVEALGESPGTVRIGAERHGPSLQFRVVDDGPGFPETILKEGVRPFVTSRDSGTGLGLAIVKRFARDLSGELSIFNRVPKGACVLLSLPCTENHD